MKKVLFIAVLSILIFTNIAMAQSGLISADQIAGAPTIISTAGENITAGELVKIINDGGFKAYKYISRFINDPAYLISGGTNNAYITATMLTSTSALIAFYDAGDSGKGKAVIATISDTTITCGTPTYLISGGTANSYISATRLTDTSALIAFSDAGDSNKGKAVIATVSDTTITCGTPTYLISGGTTNYYISATMLTSTSVLIAFRDDGDSSKGKAVIATISDTTITCGTPTYLISGGTNNTNISATMLTSTSALIAFRDDGDSKGKAVIATVSGTTITCGTPTYLISGGTNNPYISATRLTDTSALIAFRDDGDSNKGKAVIATVSGTTITCGTPTYLISGGTNNPYISATRLTDTSALIAFYDAGDSGKAVIATVSGTTITCGTPTYLISGGTNNIYISATRLTDTSALIAFQDAGDSNKGKAVIAKQLEYTYMLPAISNSAVTSGNSGTFTICRPFSKVTNSGFSFSAAQPYFINATTSAWTTTPTNYYVGYALDTTSIFIDGSYYTNAVGQTSGNSTLPVSLIRK